MTPENRKKMIDGLKAVFPDWYDFELEFSCFETNGNTLAILQECA
jgi:hypothetical protein